MPATLRCSTGLLSIVGFGWPHMLASSSISASCISRIKQARAADCGSCDRATGVRPFPGSSLFGHAELAPNRWGWCLGMMSAETAAAYIAAIGDDRRRALRLDLRMGEGRLCMSISLWLARTATQTRRSPLPQHAWALGYGGVLTGGDVSSVHSAPAEASVAILEPRVCRGEELGRTARGSG
eukprot:scaffold69607_cov27-Tisochrysis_lutea.AAC.3